MKLREWEPNPWPHWWSYAAMLTAVTLGAAVHSPMWLAIPLASLLPIPLEYMVDKHRAERKDRP
jgi:hypothetical protein